MAEDLLIVKNLKKYYPITGGVFGKEVGVVKAVDDVSFTVKRGETFGLVGESGCGKSTTGRSLLRLIEPTSGEVVFDGTDIIGLQGEALRKMRRNMQIVFQDPFASLNPRHNIEKILEEPLRVHGIGSPAERKERVRELLEVVGLSSYHATRYPHQFSGGQRQRIGIARALMLNPKLIVADEPVSALDVSIQSQVLNLMQDLQRDLGLTYLFIAHDLSVVRHISDRVGVMYLGRLVELSRSEELYRQPLHPYTRALLSAVPSPDPDAVRERIILQGDVPSPSNPPTGCTFHTRCPHVTDECRQVRPDFRDVGGGHFVACHLYNA
ncbi:ABC transporter ATP-binding protein [Brevibacillus borstelensis]|uniref:ABC transporter ATP-binding protein n=1 Tax=Brevibacillus borstelensis AK1 TaxID=1300222 RepID=M8DUV7_9BACL|nr:dipeptide ABC transporter ATP-binding protein [Brevibacillus borstelensis]EMT50776.1 ABC transporter ATP-binding protein [Brevibacillus borstelensis AK1]KKX55909.1 peptide ABC transporter ATPase [Brevibacillus borstelensis cifa_chp40]MED1743332.1 dipeptide ABC transporter ATP-binding protein [Brevibacillus borstelensis]MED1853148.1 dipeptide ABC transporter ATP-binding protein [Brevibacillus borstelensis]MED1874537.1 dipeptide ABC transporter ATP-binding protein [Brevibacillus borstelensis]